MNICDRSIFKIMFLKYHSDVERFIVSRGAHQEEALDIVQESFLRLWEKCKEVTEKSAKSFLFTTSSRILIDDFRKNQTKHKYKLTLNNSADVQDGQYQLEMSEFKERFAAVMNAMPAGAREVFLLHRFEKMKYREIAEQIGISSKAVEKRMQIALLHLAKNKIPKIH